MMGYIQFVSCLKLSVHILLTSTAVDTHLSSSLVFHIIRGKDTFHEKQVELKLTMQAI